MRAIDRLIKYIDYKSLTNASFEKAVGLSNGYIRKLKGGKGSIGSDVLEKIILSNVDLSLKWLITGKGEMVVSEEGNHVQKEEVLSEDPRYQVLLEQKDNLIAGLQSVINEQKEIISDLKTRSSSKAV